MRRTFLFLAWISLFGLLTAFTGWWLMDFETVSTLPYAIVSALIFVQAFATYATKHQSITLINTLIISVQLILCIGYYLEAFYFSEIWKSMLALVIIGIQLCFLGRSMHVSSLQHWIVRLQLISTLAGIGSSLYFINTHSGLAIAASLVSLSGILALITSFVSREQAIS
jgi:hypothetical protein